MAGDINLMEKSEVTPEMLTSPIKYTMCQRPGPGSELAGIT